MILENSENIYKHFFILKETYKGCVKEVVLGYGANSLRVGGENGPAFHFFEGTWPNPPHFALEVCDLEPTDWPVAVVERFKDVLDNPTKWALEYIRNFGAEAICLQLTSTDPIEKDTSPEEAAALVRDVSEGIEVPLIVFGSGTADKDARVLTKVAEVCAGKSLFMGPVVRQNLEEIGKAAQAFGHGVIIQTPLEIPMAKELSIKLSKMLPSGKILLDPLSPALGYGMEYGYSVMERQKLAALVVNDTDLQMPLVANIGKECWETKEARESEEQGVLWEAMTGLSYLLAGANFLVLRHPKSHQVLKRIF